MIIGLSGYAKSGKDTVAEIIIDLTKVTVPGLMTAPTWKVKKFSGKLKHIASILTGIPEYKFEDQEFKNSYLGSEWNQGVKYNDRIPGARMTVREFLQNLGTDAVRDGLHPNAWVNALMADYAPDQYSDYPSRMPKWIVTDVRFPNEAQAIKDKGGVIIRIDRPGIKPVNSHPSETSLDNWDFDYKIANASDLVALRQSVEVLLNKIQWQ